MVKKRRIMNKDGAIVLQVYDNGAWRPLRKVASKPLCEDCAQFRKRIEEMREYSQKTLKNAAFHEIAEAVSIFVDSILNHVEGKKECRR